MYVCAAKGRIIVGGTHVFREAKKSLACVGRKEWPKKRSFFFVRSTNTNTGRQPAHSNSILLHDQPDIKATLIFRAKANPHTREQTITPISVTFRARLSIVNKSA